MSYLVLARKWRPQTFSDVVGQRHVTKTLQNAIGQGRLAHAVMFSGARGVGKTSIARILAKAINCAKGTVIEPCNKCENCKEITRGIAVDVIEIDGASNRGIDEIRSLRETIIFLPVKCRKKVYIIDEVHMLTREAFNALLKTLEEPPSHVHFIFATTEPSKVPDTIRSRCQHYEFRLLTNDELNGHISSICRQESIDIESNAIELVVKAAQGSMRDCLSLLDQVIAFGAATEKEVEEALGLIPINEVKELFNAILQADPIKALLIIDKVYRFGGNLKGLIEELVLLMRDVLLYHDLGDDGGQLYINPIDHIKGLYQLAHDETTLHEMLSILSRSLDAMRYTQFPRIAVESVILRLIHLNKAVSISEVIERLPEAIYESGDGLRDKDKNKDGEREKGAGRGKGLENEQEKGRQLEDEQGKGQEIEIEDVKGQGETASADGDMLEGMEASQFMDFLRDRSVPIWGLLKKASSIEITANNSKDASKNASKDTPDIVVKVRCKGNFQKIRLSDRKLRGEIEGYAGEFFKRPVLFVIEDADNGISGEDKADKDSVSAEASRASGERRAEKAHNSLAHKKEGLKNHPLVREAIKIFDARIEDIEVIK